MITNKTKRTAPIILLLTALTLLFVFGIFASERAGSEPEVHIVGTNLSFSESVYIKYAVSLDNVSNDADVRLLIWRSPSDTYTLGSESAILSPEGSTTLSGKECLVFNYTGLSAKEMTDYVYARAIYETDKGIYYSDVKKYSVLTYVYNKLGYTGAPTQNTELASLLDGLLEYGASAQTYFNYKTNDLATDRHVKISLVNGCFEDGCSYALVIPRTKITISAPATNELGSFVYWKDENGKILSSSSTLEITAGDENSSISAVYVSYEGGIIDGAGHTLSNDSFAMTDALLDESKIKDVSASELQAIITNGLSLGDVYRVIDGNPITVSNSINGNGASVIVPAGIRFTSLTDATISNLLLYAPVTLDNCTNVNLSNVAISSESSALLVSDNCKDVTIDSCRMIANDIGISTLTGNTVIKNSYVSADAGIVISADECTVYNSNIVSNECAISVTGSDNAVNNCSILSSVDGLGIAVSSDSLNTLLSYNFIKGTPTSVEVNDSTNTVVILNSIFNVVASNNTNLYIVKNSIGGALNLNANNYLLCDSNSYHDNGNDHTLVSVDNDNVNGDTLIDVDARNEVGVKEELLPHTNKDLFLEMERKSTVKDVINDTEYDLNTYIEENAKANGVVIVPPGAYTTSRGDYLYLTEKMNNTDIYAFGVYNEHEFITNEEYLADPDRKNNYIIYLSYVENLTINGMTNAYNYQALGQAHILEKLDNNRVLVVPAAGFDLEAGWGLSNPGVFRGSFYACHKGEPTPWFETSYTYIQTNDDKTIVIELTEENYNKLGVGDILCCRMAGDNQTTIQITNVKNVLIKDCVLHGYAAALAHTITGRSYNVKMERVHNCPKSPAIIDEATYDLYKDLESKYPGVDFEMTVDAEGRYRGTQARFCSVDATHVVSGQGLDIESCLFEQMCDDGSNQHGSSARLHSIKDNGDGTATIYVKGNVTQVYHSLYASSDNHERNMTPLNFLKGDNIFVYTPGGEIVCDAICLTSHKSEPQLVELYKLDVMTYFIHVYSVTVPVESVNFDALEGYDLKDNHYRMDNKITVDNISHVSGNFTIDNYMVRNSWSRGVLTKTVNATIKNSTFQHIKSAGILANCEPEWGESTIPRNITVENCVFDNTGYTGETWDNPKNSPVYITGLSTYGEANINKIIASNITIMGCEIKNYGHQYGICIDGAQNIKILDNVFDPLDVSDPGHFIDIKTAVNVEISGNMYRDENGQLTTISGISAEDYAGIHGSDVGDTFKSNCDIYIAGTHISSYKIVPASKENKELANILSSKLKEICGYSIASTVMPYTKEIKLVVNDTESNLIKSNRYTVSCIDGQLVITTETNASMIYAIEDFVKNIALKNESQQSIYFDEGYSESFEFITRNISATDTSIFKYTGVWNQSGDAMVSGSDADYVEFDFTGHTVTLIFNGATSFKVRFDGAEPTEYTVEGEKTFTVPDGKHTIRIQCTDRTKPISLVSVTTFSSELSKTANKSKYVQFIGDSMVDYDDSFAHRIGDILGWDYSVVVGDSLPTTSVSRAPEIFVLFLGTDAITSSSTSNDINTFKTTYKNLITSITRKYSSAKVYIMQPLSTSNEGDMFNTSHNRYTAVNAMKDRNLTGSWDNISIALNNNVQIIESTNKLINWNIEFDTSVSATYPTQAGNYTVTVKLAEYLNGQSGNSSYINASFDLDNMGRYPSSGSTATTITKLTEDGVTFNRFTFNQNGHAFINGNDYANKSVSVAGRYLVIKYRASGEYSLVLETRTNDYGTDKAATYRDENGATVGCISKVTKTENNVPENWEIAIVDLAQFKNYTVGLTNTKVQLRITTTSKTLDIAYAAIVDDLSEAKMVVMFELDDYKYRFYEDWSKVGEDVYLNGEEPEPEIDLSFVNQEFTFISMKKWMNGTKSPDLMFVDPEGKEHYSRFNFTSTGHVFFTGVNDFVNISGDTGRYFIFKYRSTNDNYISFDALTSDYESTSTGANMGKQTKPASNIIAGEWEVAVIDLSTLINSGYGTKYTTDTEGLGVWLRLTTGVSEIDISYMAIVDDLDEASTFIKYKGDTTYVHYTDWSKAGASVTID